MRPAPQILDSVLAIPAGLLHFERSMPTLPALQFAEPRYCLLVFGPDAKTRVWLIIDADRLHVLQDDKYDVHLLDGGSGGGRCREILVGNVMESDGATIHRELKLLLTNDLVTLTMRSDGWGLKDLVYLTSTLIFSDRAENAPVVQFNGVLMMKAELREGAETVNLFVEIGSAGLGAGSFASISHSVAEQVSSRPVAEIAYRRRDGVPEHRRVVLAYDC